MAALRVIFSTGSPLSPEDYAYVYDKVKSDVMLASISGGTDICSCFALGNPMLPVRQGELQAFGLGLDACALDRETKEPVVGEKAELVCRRPFVAAPVCFFGDDDAKTKYRKAYFEEGDGVWYHGDLVEMTGSVGESGGLVIHGRSDTTLKPGGVRIGTAEVYRFAECVAGRDSLVIGEQMKVGNARATCASCSSSSSPMAAARCRLEEIRSRSARRVRRPRARADQAGAGDPVHALGQEGRVRRARSHRAPSRRTSGAPAATRSTSTANWRGGAVGRARARVPTHTA